MEIKNKIIPQQNSSMSEIPTNSNDVREDDVEKLANEWIDKNSHKWSNNTDEVGDNYGSFIAGYNKAKENTYTEEQVREAFMNGHTLYRNVTDNYDEALESANEFIQSLKQHKQ